MGENMFSFGSGQIFKKGKNKLSFKIPAGFFQSGTFSLMFLLVEDKKRVIKHERDVFSFTIVDGGSAELGAYMGREPGYIRPRFEWTNKIKK